MVDDDEDDDEDDKDDMNSEVSQKKVENDEDDDIIVSNTEVESLHNTFHFVNNDSKEEELEEEVSIKRINLSSETIEEVEPLENDTIELNLEEIEDKNNVNYKRLTTSKLKEIAIDKGLVSNNDVQKMKKTELLELLK